MVLCYVLAVLDVGLYRLGCALWCVGLLNGVVVLLIVLLLCIFYFWFGLLVIVCLVGFVIGLVALISYWFALWLLISGRRLVGVVVVVFWDFAFELVYRIAGAFRIWLVSLSCLRVIWLMVYLWCLLCCF